MARIVAALAIAAICADAAPALAQADKASRGPDRNERGGFGIGGSFTGRMNLLGPSDSGAEPRPPSLPAPPRSYGAQPLGANTNDIFDPKAFDGLDLPKIVPNQPNALPPPPRPGALPPGSTAALPDPTATPAPKRPLILAGQFTATGDRIPNGVHWRVFTDQPDGNGEHALVAESREAEPRFDLDPGGYVVHAVYGLVSVAQYVSVGPQDAERQVVVLPAGAVRLTALVGDVKVGADRVSFTLTRDDAGVTRTVAEKVKPGTLLRLPAGAYHVTSSYGDANAIVEADLQLAPGKFVEAQVHHRAARITLKLTDAPGGAARNDTSWTILTPGGDVIRESIGALPNIVLSEGDYTAIARNDGRMFQQNFEVRSGFDANVEVRTR